MQQIVVEVKSQHEEVLSRSRQEAEAWRKNKVNTPIKLHTADIYTHQGWVKKKASSAKFPIELPWNIVCLTSISKEQKGVRHYVYPFKIL